MNTAINGPAIICQSDISSNGIKRKCKHKITVSIQDFIADTIVCPKCNCEYKRHTDQDMKVVEVVEQLGEAISSAQKLGAMT